MPSDKIRAESEHIPQDSRNHGDSPASDQTTYLDYASDISHFLKQRSLKNVVLMGHSMWAAFLLQRTRAHRHPS